MTGRLLHSLSRRTSGRRYIASLDGVRCLALALVLVYHVEVARSVAIGQAQVVDPFGRVYRPPELGPRAYDWFTRALLQGPVGLEVFFMVSAFMLVLPFAAARLSRHSPPGLGKYLRRRTSRLVPPYAAALVVSFGAAALVTASTVGSLLPHLAASLGYLHAPILGGINPLNGPVWSLEVEAQFYLVLPLLVFVFHIRSRAVRRAVLVAAALAISAAQAVGIADAGWLSISIANYLQFFLVGFLVADVYLVEWAESPRPNRGWDVISGLGWPAVVAASILGDQAMDHLVLPWICGLLLAAAVKGPVSRRVLSNRWVVMVGVISYSVYLLHYPMVVLGARALRGFLPGPHLGDLIVLWALILPAVLVAGAVFFRLIERPSMDPAWPGRVAGRVRAWAGHGEAPAPAPSALPDQAAP
jgi:peptidoglycan/LPS O-acetylase OafA/YrhL